MVQLLMLICHLLSFALCLVSSWFVSVGENGSVALLLLSNGNCLWVHTSHFQEAQTRRVAIAVCSMGNAKRKHTPTSYRPLLPSKLPTVPGIRDHTADEARPTVSCTTYQLREDALQPLRTRHWSKMKEGLEAISSWP